MDVLETAIDLYKLAHLYETEDVLHLITEKLIESVTVNNLLMINDLAETYENKALQKACEKV